MAFRSNGFVQGASTAVVALTIGVMSLSGHALSTKAPAGKQHGFAARNFAAAVVPATHAETVQIAMAGPGK